MVKKLEDNLSYILYIRKKVNENLQFWSEEKASYENQPNNNFFISFKNKSEKIDFIKDRGLLELKIYHNSSLVSNSKEIYDSILKHLPEQDINWPLSISVNLIDYYIVFLKRYYNTN